MRIKCPQCKAKIDKKSQYCQYCGYEIYKKEQAQPQTQETTTNKEQNIPTHKTAFITCGDIFFVGNNTKVLGIAVQTIKVGDVILFNKERLIVESIDTFQFKDIKSVENGNCALTFKINNQQKFKEDILTACKKFGPTNRPINFGKEPTSEYIFLDFE